MTSTETFAHTFEEICLAQRELMEIAAWNSDKQKPTEVLVDVAMDDEATDLLLAVREAAKDPTHPMNMDGLHELRADLDNDPIALGSYVLALLNHDEEN